MKNQNCHTWIWFSTELAQYRRNEIGNSENRQKIMCAIFKKRSNGEEQMFQFMALFDINTKNGQKIILSTMVPLS